MSKKWIAIISVYLGLLGICLFVLYAIPSIRGALEKTYIAEYGVLDVKDEVSAFVVKDEYVFVAKQSSSVNRLSEEGELVKAASAVVELKHNEADESTSESGSYDDIVKELGKAVKETEKGFTSEPGYVSYNVDGAEAQLTIENISNLSPADYEALTTRKSKPTPNLKCRKGEPVFKIVRNGKWYLVFYTSKENGERYIPGRYLSMDVKGEPVRVRVYAAEELEKNTRVMLECKSFFEGFLDMRSIDTKITLASAEGLIIRKSSIVENEGEQGVFVKNKLGEHVYRPIMLIASDGDKCVAYSDVYLDAEGNFVETIRTYDEIIEEPSDDDMASLKPKDGKKNDDKG